MKRADPEICAIGDLSIRAKKICAILVPHKIAAGRSECDTAMQDARNRHPHHPGAHGWRGGAAFRGGGEQCGRARHIAAVALQDRNLSPRSDGSLVHLVGAADRDRPVQFHKNVRAEK